MARKTSCPSELASQKQMNAALMIMVQNLNAQLAKVPAPEVKKKRKLSDYNRFMKEEIARLKAENPNIEHNEAFKQAVANWAKGSRKARQEAEPKKAVIKKGKK